MAKRLLDLLLAGCGLIVLSPVLLAIALAIRLDSPGPVFFRQVRVGRHGREFRIHKFRTMTHAPTGGFNALGAVIKVTCAPASTAAWAMA